MIRAVFVTRFNLTSLDCKFVLSIEYEDVACVPRQAIVWHVWVLSLYIYYLMLLLSFSYSKIYTQASLSSTSYSFINFLIIPSSYIVTFIFEHNSNIVRPIFNIDLIKLVWFNTSTPCYIYLLYNLDFLRHILIWQSSKIWYKSLLKLSILTPVTDKTLI